MKHVDHACDAGDEAEIVLDDDHRCSRSSHGSNQVGQMEDLFVIESRRGLIEQNHAWLSA